MFLVSLLGCCGAIGESSCILKTYGGILLILFISTIISGIVAAVKKEDINSWVQEAGRTGIEKWVCDPITLEVSTLINTHMFCFIFWVWVWKP